MDPTFDAFLRSWPFDPWMLVALVVHGRPVSARLARAASPRSGSLARPPARCVLRRSCDALPGTRFADRIVHRRCFCKSTCCNTSC